MVNLLNSEWNEKCVGFIRMYLFIFVSVYTWFRPEELLRCIQNWYFFERKLFYLIRGSNFLMFSTVFQKKQSTKVLIFSTGIENWTLHGLVFSSRIISNCLCLVNTRFLIKISLFDCYLKRTYRNYRHY